MGRNVSYRTYVIINTLIVLLPAALLFRAFIFRLSDVSLVPVEVYTTLNPLLMHAMFLSVLSWIAELIVGKQKKSKGYMRLKRFGTWYRAGLTVVLLLFLVATLSPSFD
jgi:hypothetical protein